MTSPTTPVLRRRPPRATTSLTRFPLSEFARSRFRYRAGEHVTVLGPTGWGKTHLSFALLRAVARPSLPAMNLVIKPRDSTVERWSTELDMPRVRSWPLVPSPFRAPKPGWMIWPRSTGDPDRDDDVLYAVMLAALRDAYRKGNRIVFSDEAAGLAELRPSDRDRTKPPLERPMIALWRRGRSLGAGMWAASQRPVDIPRDAYTQASHLFLGKDRDRQGRARYAEISGVDPDVVQYETARLEKWHWLYIRDDGRMAIITPD